MSVLDQAKKEAKRLFNLAKANSEINPPHVIEIDNLSKAREIVSFINGYKNWHEYEEVLKRKDVIFGKVDKVAENKISKEIYDNLKYYIGDIEFNKIANPVINNNILIIPQDHKNIILGRNKEKTLFDKKEKKWILNNYPLLVTGSTGSGKTEILLSMASQYIDNNEGIIYMDGRGDAVLYSKIFSYAKEKNRLSDLYCLNFMTGGREAFGETNTPEKLSHTIDPINPMLGNNEYFDIFFGRIGIIVHDILKELHGKKQLMDTQSLESILMLNNLINWTKEKTFFTPTIKEYLLEIGLKIGEENDEEDFNSALEKHGVNAHRAFETVKLLQNYRYMFKVDCSLNMERIFLERKLLLVLLPALEKSTVEIADLGSLIASQIKHIDQKYSEYKKHFQNIILDEFGYYLNCFDNLNLSQTKNNYIFACQDYGYNNNIFNYVVNNAKTYVIMKKECSDFPDKIKLDLINNLDVFPKLSNKTNQPFIKNFSRELRELREGQAYVLSYNSERTDDVGIINNQYKYYCEYIHCEYIPSKRQKELWLVQHPRPVIYTKEKLE